jgi:UPF0716 protein FxsA
MWKWVLFALASAFVGLEVAVLLWVGRLIGIGWTLAWIVVSALVGMAMVRAAGMRGVMRIHRRLRAQELPTQELLDLALVLIGGFLLIAPGFVSDALGLLLLLAPVRWALRGLAAIIYGELVPPAEPATRSAPEDVIEIRAND